MKISIRVTHKGETETVEMLSGERGWIWDRGERIAMGTDPLGGWLTGFVASALGFDPREDPDGFEQACVRIESTSHPEEWWE